MEQNPGNGQGVWNWQQYYPQAVSMHGQQFLSPTHTYHPAHSASELQQQVSIDTEV